MKAILRKFGDDSYIVKEVSIGKNGTYECEGIKIEETNILSIIGQSKPDIVRCSACGEMVKNTAKDIREHINIKNSMNSCLICGAHRVNNEQNQKIKYVANEDGTFHRTLHDDVTITCTNSYPYIDITSPNRPIRCKYRSCSKETIGEDNTFFGKYPNVFDDMITVDAITFKEIYGYNKETKLTLKCRGTIEAIANSKGIIDRFEIRTRYDYKTVYYSKKYNKLFFNHYGTYVELTPSYYWSEDKLTYVKKTIANLYS